ncbi:response regulator [Paraburkholderia sp. DHOC27]|uniref:response regulator n=1 Tax=Paraburkholderia sp. DHOC27 TaxID=2303330 RepID=UPI000E3E1DBA|nr:response regulator [Paraburkholderia sp. DHOC27]RFU49708.1 response regulator [Paraburkholderia sp. DHOC27]
MQRLHTRSTVQKWTARSLNVRGHQLRVLVVDDTTTAADALAAYLSIEDVGCRVAYGGHEAINTAISWDPHVILMDISMPECNGFDASLAVRRNPRTAHIAIVAHTSLDEAEVRRHLSDAEFDGYYQKGQSLDRLLDLIKTFVH